ncbi:HNH endonuclease [Streptomyces sp. NPDC001709]
MAAPRFPCPIPPKRDGGDPHASKTPPPLFRPRVSGADHWWALVAPALDVDHVRPLSLGGEDIDSNVQVLCRGCHQLKTSTEFGAS